MENTHNQKGEARRSFLKKMVYVAPAVVALGALTAPVGAHASVFVGQVYTNPTNSNQGVESIHIGDATVVGNSQTKVIEGGTYTNLNTGTVTQFTADQVKANDWGLFTWAKTYFGNIFG
jgi:hypothetical protein